MNKFIETYVDKDYGAEVIERIYNEVTTYEDIDFILDCKELLYWYHIQKRNFYNIKDIKSLLLRQYPPKNEKMSFLVAS